ncbi:MAG: adenylate/guanylate cyclase domain-containing protein [Acetobacteraceae bacterium]|nr:adenylate/guanylate cyclase domain-containing protein [Acetobacteraceae bacterium]
MRFPGPATLAEGVEQTARREGATRDRRRLELVGAADVEQAARPVPRLAVILAADIVEYTRHMAEDEAGTHARVAAIRRDIVEPHIARHEARFVKSTGDGFLAEFWSATRAAWFAVEFQRAVRAWNARRRRGRPLQFRLGINLGDVIAEGHDLIGHTVNVAVRLESLAEPGGVLVSYPVVAAIRDPGLRFEDRGELALKNLREPVRGYRVRLRPGTPARSRPDPARSAPGHGRGA